jgi:PEP-CTERM motif
MRVDCPSHESASEPSGEQAQHDRKRVAIAASALTVLLFASSAQAAILFDFNPPFPPNPDQNLKFNDPGLVLSGMTVEGYIDVPALVFEISGLESLVASGGQASVSSSDDGFTWLLFQPSIPNVGFGAFEANLGVFKPGGGNVAGIVNVTVTDTNGLAPSQSFAVNSSGNNFFNLLATDSQFIRSVLIESDVDLSEIKQMRVGGVTNPGDQTTQVPEPGALGLFGAGLLIVARRLRQ